MGETPSLPFAAAHALVVGIQEYGSGLRALETPAADARAISALLASSTSSRSSFSSRTSPARGCSRRSAACSGG